MPMNLYVGLSCGLNFELVPELAVQSCFPEIITRSCSTSPVSVYQALGRL
jgi:hypothetical protein